MRSQKLEPSAFVAFANSVNTLSDMFRLFDQLEELKRLLFKDKAGSISEKAGFSLPGNLAPIFKDIQTSGLEPQGDLEQQRFLDSIIEYLKKLPVVSVTLAFEPTDSFVGKLKNEISTLCGSKVILDLVVNQYIMAGAIFEYKGRRKEYILKDKLEGVIARLTSEIKTKQDLELQTNRKQ